MKTTVFYVSNFRRIYLLLISFVLILAARGTGQSDQGLLAAMRMKIDTLEKKIAYHDSCILLHAKALSEEDKKVTSHDTVIEELKNSLHRQFGTPAIQGEGFTIGVNATMVLQGTNNPNVLSEGIKKVGDASNATEVTFKKDFDKIHGKAFLRNEAGQGNGINQELSVLCVANASAYPGQGIWVAEAWYEQKLLLDKFDATIGYLFPAAYFDNSGAANDQTTQFLSAIFVNNPTLEMPVYAPGLVIKLTPVDKIELAFAVFDGNADWQNIGDDLFNIGQVSYSPTVFGLPGNYHIFGWYNQLPHTVWSDAFASRENSYGFGLSADQQLTAALTAFARLGWRSPETFDSQAVAIFKVYTTLITQSWSLGVQINGNLWHRDDDAVGIGFGQATPSRNYKDALGLENATAESHLEIYYRIKCFEHMGISPDFQYIMNPFGKDLNPFGFEVKGNTANIAVVGIRSMVDF